jgi:D-beta-D-heptose 7-phosphate kinase/D-beta-D-heptose 1-phosphate adenosyltransferase
MEKQLIKIVDKFEGKTIGVVGDIMLDHFMLGNISRVSPEAPVPVVSIYKESFRPGGAGHAASTVASLGGNALLFGVVGEDPAASQLFHALRTQRVNTTNILKDGDMITTEKIRVLARNQHVARIDRDNTKSINTHTENEIIKLISRHTKAIDGLVISDYGKGSVTERLTKTVIKLTQKHRKFIIGDTKAEHAHYFKHATIITPNCKEAVEISKTENLEKTGRIIQKQLLCNVLITAGSSGMVLFHGRFIKHFASQARWVFNVAGAGDTVVATLALALSAGASLEEATSIASYAAGIMVEKNDTAVITLRELKRRLTMK